MYLVFGLPPSGCSLLVSRTFPSTITSPPPTRARVGVPARIGLAALRLAKT